MKNQKIYYDIIDTDNFKRQKIFLQHGNISVYEHSIRVAQKCYEIATSLNIDVDLDSLIKGALLHDYFLYDWHEKQEFHRFHGIRHPKFARDNAKRDFGLTQKEENMILSHMFPLGKIIPTCKESVILCCVDKYCALSELISSNTVLKKIKGFVQI